MARLQLKSEAQIIGSMAQTVLARTGLNDLNPGSILLTLLEAVAQEDFAQYYQMLQIVRNYNLDTTTGTDLDNRAFEFGLIRLQAKPSTGKITIQREEGFSKISSAFYSGFRSRISGDTQIFVNDASEFPSSGTLIIGRDTANEEEVAYASAPTDNTNYWTITLSTALTNDHALDEEVILKQGVDITIPAGTVVRVPASGRNEEITFFTTREVQLLAGEESVEDVDVKASLPGSKGNINVGQITGTDAFPNPPFAGARATNDSSFSSGQERETDPQLRNRIKSFIQALSQSTRSGIQGAISGLTDPTTAKRVVSSNIILPDSVAEPVKIYIDDGTGFEPSFNYKGSETILESANGGETRLQLDLFPLVKAQVESGTAEPYNFSSSKTLIVEVGTESETITFNTTDFAIPEAATAEEIVAAINDRATLIQARTSQIGQKVVITAISDTNEEIQVTGGTANTSSLLNFPTDRVYTFYLYKNDQLLSKDGETAFVDSDAGPWDFSSGDITLSVTVDGKTANNQTVTIGPDDFNSPSEAANATAELVVDIINAQLVGATASEVDGKVRITSNTRLSASSKIKINASDIQALMSFPTTEVAGKNRDYTLNAELGVIELKEALGQYDKITAGSRNTRAFLTASIAEDYTLAGTETLDIQIDGGSTQTITLAAQTNADASTVADDINSKLVGGTATTRTLGPNTYLEIRTNTLAESGGSIKILSTSTGNAKFGFDLDTLVENIPPHTAYAISTDGGPYEFVEGQTLVVVLDNVPTTKTFIITMDYDGSIDSGSSTTVFVADGFDSIFPSDDELNSFYLAFKSGANTISGTVEEVENPTGNTFRYIYDTPPTNFEDFAAGDLADFSEMTEEVNNGKFLVTGVVSRNTVHDAVLDKDLSNPSALTPSSGDRYLVSAGAGTSTSDAVLDKDVSNPSGLTPNDEDRYIVHEDANDTTLDSVKELLTDSTSASATHGFRYIVHGTGTNDWAGHDHEIAVYNGVGTPGWQFITPTDGDVVLDEDSGDFYQYSSDTGTWTQNDWGGKAGKVAEWDADGSAWVFSTPTDGEVRSVTDESLLYQYSEATNAWTANTWGGKGNQIAEWDGSEWDYTVPASNDVVDVADEGLSYQYSGSAWAEFKFWVEVTNASGELESGSEGTGLVGQRRQISDYTGSTGTITVGSAFRATPSAADNFIILPGTRANVVDFFNNTKVTSLSTKANVELATGAAQIQISSKLDGSDGYVQITGGAANTELGFSTTKVRGLQGYLNFTGLIKLVHKTIYGDETDPVAYPGVGAAGIKFQVLPPTVEEASFAVELTLGEGVSLSNLETEVKSAIISYVKGRGVGESVILSQIIDRIVEIEGIEDVVITTPAENVVPSQNELIRTRASLISVTAA